jgi:hypothetical protein
MFAVCCWLLRVAVVFCWLLLCASMCAHACWQRVRALMATYSDIAAVCCLLLQIAGYMRYPWPLLKTLLVVRSGDQTKAAAAARSQMFSNNIAN